MAFFKFRKAGDAGKPAAPAQPESVEAVRRRARHRLIGAAVLVLVGVLGFPLLFDTQPRPMAVDIPIEIPDRNKAKPLSLPVATAPRGRGQPSGRSRAGEQVARIVAGTAGRIGHRDLRGRRGQAGAQAEAKPETQPEARAPQAKPAEIEEAPKAPTPASEPQPAAPAQGTAQPRPSPLRTPTPPAPARCSKASRCRSPPRRDGRRFAAPSKAASSCRSAPSPTRSRRARRA